MAVLAASAQALEHPFLEELGAVERAGVGDVRALAIDPESGDLLVIVQGSVGVRGIYRFRDDGTPAEFADLGSSVLDGEEGPDETPEGGFDSTSFSNASEAQIAIAPPGAAGGTEGDIYVTQSRRHLIDVFSAGGTYLGQLTAYKEGPLAEGPGEVPLGKTCGVAVDAAGSVYVGGFDGLDLIHRYLPSGDPASNADNVANFNALAGPSGPCTVAAGVGPSAGALFANRFTGELFKLDGESGALQYKLGDGHTTVAVDPTTGNVLAPVGEEVREYDASGLTPTPPVHTIPSCSKVQSVAVDPGSGRIFLAREGSNRIAVYGPAVPTAPTIGEACSEEDAWTASVAAFEAQVQAKVNPNGLKTTYRIEYGPTAAYGKHSAELEVGADDEVHIVGLSLGGLAPATTYHWRIVATNSAGASAGPDRSFATYAAPAPGEGGCPNEFFRIDAGALLSDCRAYELVSPVDKEGNDILSFTSAAGVPIARNQSTPVGDKLTYTAASRLCDAVSQPYAPQYIAARHERGGPDEGWDCHGISPPVGVSESLTHGGEFFAFSENLCKAWLVPDQTTAPPPAPGAVPGANNLYERANCGEEGYRTVVAGSGGFPQGITTDGRWVVIRAGSLFIEGDGGDKAQLCTLPDRTSLESCASGPFAGVDGLAEDGSRVYWSSNSSGPGAIYLRENPNESQSALEHGSTSGAGRLQKGSAVVTEVSTVSGEFEVGQSVVAGRGVPFGATVVAVGAESITLSEPATLNRPSEALSAYSRCTQPEKACTVPVSEAVSPGKFEARNTTQKATLLGAAADGSAALFAFDPDKTGLDAGTAKDDLYRFDADTGIPTLIAHNVLGLLGSSADLRRVYLVSEDAIAGAGENSEEETAIPGKPNLYLYGQGAGFAFIATLAAADARDDAEFQNPSPLSTVPAGHRARVSPDGGAAAFVSYAPLTGYDNTDAGNGLPASEVFRYEAATGRLTCVSCNPSRARPTGRELLSNEDHPFGLSIDAQIVPGQHALYFPRALSEDGGRIFFESVSPLLLRDTNNSKDVYQWEAAGRGTCKASSPTFNPATGGCLALISSGRNPKDSSFVDATSDGSDVFFTTEQSLVGRDPGLIDIYDARVDGGFPEPLEPVPCEGDACQDSPPPPVFATPGSAAVNAPGNLRPRRSCRAMARRAAKLSRRAKRLRRRAKAAARPQRARRRARHAARRAQAESRKARRCRRASRRAGR